MDFYKAKIKSDGSLDRFKLIIVVRGYLNNKEMIGDNWYPRQSTRTMEYFLADYSKHEARVHPFYFILAFLQANVKHRVFVELDSIYGE